MTRGMFVTVLGRIAGVDTADYAGQTPFKDVPANMYYAPYVAWAAKHGVTSGMGDGTFSPDGLINREQMATFFVRYFEKFDVELKQTEFGPKLQGTKEELEKVIEEDYDYDGYKIIQMNDDEMAYFYSNPAENKYDLERAAILRHGEIPKAEKAVCCTCGNTQPWLLRLL